MGWTGFITSICVIAVLWASLLTTTSISRSDQFLLGTALLVATWVWVYWHRKFSFPFFRWVSGGTCLAAMAVGAFALLYKDGDLGWIAGYLFIVSLVSAVITKVADDTPSPPKEDKAGGAPQPRTRVQRQVLVTCTTCAGSVLYGDCPTCNNVRWWYELRYVDE
ncbi:hypothetical protein C6558_13290 [Ensifer sp. NM-2]|uniref:hypothetical protein n=1 Tax=Ensifer sp. NM-2 TaxID=2109730 RepID=UPI000D12DEE4|nr:hypothetical protein [Ensifer sp. NM-2]PSS64468.1 hypothetical protein C6558_13290 [Ensifer sp. NM-2]